MDAPPQAVKEWEVCGGNQTGTLPGNVIYFVFQEEFKMPVKTKHESTQHHQLAAGEHEAAAHHHREAAHHHECGEHDKAKQHDACA